MIPSSQRILIMALLLFIGVTGPFAIADSVRLGADAKPVTLTAKELAARAAAVKASERSIRDSGRSSCSLIGIHPRVPGTGGEASLRLRHDRLLHLEIQ